MPTLTGERMRERIFVDSHYLIALLNPSDQYHDLALDCSRELDDARLWTTDWVLIEVADALCMSPGLRLLAARTLKAARSGGNMIVVGATPELWQKALSFYERHADKQWSFTD